jgi:peptidyl-prolyl cis-trans isomerase D
MITWIQQTFQQHFRVVFAVLLGLVIISFVFTIGVPGVGRAERRAMSRPFFDLNLTAEADARKLNGDAQLSVFLQAGYMALDGERLQQYALQRYTGLALAERLGLPAPTRPELEEHIKKMQRFVGENGQFDAKKYSEFRDSLKKMPGVSEADITRVLSDDIRGERVQKLLAGPGYVLPTEVKKQVAAADTTWSVSVVSIDYGTFNPTIKPTDAELTKFFEDNAFRYEIPRQVVLSYVEFPASAYVGQVTVTETDIRAYYDTNPARFPKPGAPATPAATVASNPEADFAAVRPQVEAALKLERAQRLAARAASDFAVALYERQLPFGSPEISKVIEAQKLTFKELAPFGENNVPAVLGRNPQISEEAFRLNKDRYFSDALQTETGSVVLFWKDNVQPRQPALAEVRAKVASDFVEEEKRKRFVELGRTLRTQLSARVKAGEAFDKAVEAAAAANGVKAETKSFSNFTLRQRPQDLDYAIYGPLENLNKGEVSELVRSQNNKGLLVYAADKKVPEMSESNPNYISTRAQLAQFTAARNSGEYLEEILAAELAKSAPAAQ